MSTFGKPLPDSQNPTSSLRLPATKRIALPASERLSVITEGAQQAPDSRSSRLSFLRNSTSSAATGRTPPPAYDWVPEPPDRDPVSEPTDVEGEKLARLRKSWSDVSSRRGGWRRLVVLATIVLAVLGLTIGLGVGLTAGKKDDDDENSDNGSISDSPPADDSSSPIQQFPLGQYSFLTTLRTQRTNCTASAATWRCYPYSVFDPSDPSTFTASQTSFDWIIRNTSATYATKTTIASNVPANLTLSSTRNPFALSFAARALTYHYDSANDTSSRLTFSFPLPKTVVPSPSITSNNAASQCFFNSTILSGNIYLAAPSSSQSSGSDGTSNEIWPFAVEVTQSSPSGDGTPDCYETVDGNLGRSIESGLELMGEGRQCVCEYGNF